MRTYRYILGNILGKIIYIFFIILEMLINIIKEGEREVTSQFHRKTLFVGAMHFQDLYNFDLERVCRCGIHYATPDGRIIPFCSYNTFHRDEVEGQFLKPYDINKN